MVQRVSVLIRRLRRVEQNRKARSVSQRVTVHCMVGKASAESRLFGSRYDVQFPSLFGSKLLVHLHGPHTLLDARSQETLQPLQDEDGIRGPWPHHGARCGSASLTVYCMCDKGSAKGRMPGFRCGVQWTSRCGSNNLVKLNHLIVMLQGAASHAEYSIQLPTLQSG